VSFLARTELGELYSDVVFFIRVDSSSFELVVKIYFAVVMIILHATCTVSRAAFMISGPYK